MRNFSYSRAGTRQEALSLISTIPNAKFLGGGTNLVDLMRENVEQPDALVDVTRLASAGISAFFRPRCSRSDRFDRFHAVPRWL